MTSAQVKGKALDFETATTRDVDLHLPTLAKDPTFLARVEEKLQALPTAHRLRLGDARDLSFLKDGTVHLIVTSPPYWTLKEYNRVEGQLGYVAGYQAFHAELNKVWAECLRVLVPGGRLVVIVGDVVVSRRSALKRHKCFPLHADIQVNCEHLGFDNLTPVLWAKIANASFEAEGNSGAFLGKPFEPGAIVKNDVEYVLMFRKPGGYRSPEPRTRLLSIIPAENHRKWFTQVWTDIRGASLRDHPAPFPEELAERIIRMFSFAGDTVLDPFAGTGTTLIAAANFGRNSIGVEIDPAYAEYARARIERMSTTLCGGTRKLVVEGWKPSVSKANPPRVAIGWHGNGNGHTNGNGRAPVELARAAPAKKSRASKPKKSKGKTPPKGTRWLS